MSITTITTKGKNINVEKKNKRGAKSE